MAALFIIGDIHGCADSLEALCRLAPSDAQFYCVGDVIHRGPDSARVWQWLTQTGARSVLGNHELFTLQVLLSKTISCTPAYKRWILACRDALIATLSHWPFYDWLDNESLVIHAGLDPSVPLATFLAYLDEGAARLQHDPEAFLQAWSKLRTTPQSRQDPVLKACFQACHIRICNAQGQDTGIKDQSYASLKKDDQHQRAWFDWMEEPPCTRVYFGHWASLQPPHQALAGFAYALDAGCVWGGALLAHEHGGGERVLRVPAQERSS